ncbi:MULTISPECIES: DUF6270 domain-containing protein [unclassified Isoptericola]|uniref:DUF6270 domain-containing protein n=1 Tax=unclassified Isoptericola TaxID=2623355 RepID=UPI00364CF1E9
MSPTRVLLYGSCVSRDTFEHLAQDEFTLTGYIARQSIISAYYPPLAYELDLSAISSPFQVRVTQEALRGSLRATTYHEAGSIDLVLWDLTDERTGGFVLPDGTFVTRSVELDAASITESVSADADRYLPFGSDEHFQLFTSAAGAWWDELSSLGLASRVLVLAPEWAPHTTSGIVTPPSYGLTAESANFHFQRYFEFVEQLGAPVVRITRTTADPEHQWGSAPFHFAKPVYDLLSEIIGEFVDEIVHRKPATPAIGTAAHGVGTDRPPQPVQERVADPRAMVVQEGDAHAPAIICCVPRGIGAASIKEMLPQSLQTRARLVVVEAPADEAGHIEHTSAYVRTIHGTVGQTDHPILIGVGWGAPLAMAAAAHIHPVATVLSDPRGLTEDARPAVPTIVIATKDGPWFESDEDPSRALAAMAAASKTGVLHLVSTSAAHATTVRDELDQISTSLADDKEPLSR